MVKTKQERHQHLDDAYLLGRDFDELLEDVLDAYRTGQRGEAQIIDDEPVMEDDQTYTTKIVSTVSECLGKLPYIGESSDNTELKYDEDQLQQSLESEIDSRINWANPNHVDDFSDIHRHLSVEEQEDHLLVSLTASNSVRGGGKPATAD